MILVLILSDFLQFAGKMEDMVCNYRKCRKSLESNAWVTSCSHIFCDEHGSKEFNKKTKCPACKITYSEDGDTNLPGKFDIIRIDLSPTEQYKSMVLAGQKPEVVLEICSRALAFWTYQIHQERTYQEYVASKSKERSIQMEQYYGQLLNRTQAENTNLKSQVSSLRKEIEGNKKKYNDMAEKLMERNRQHQKLQLMYDSLRRKSITVNNMDQEAFQEASGAGGAGDFTIPISFTEGHRRAGEKRVVPTTAEREFVLNPAIDSNAGTPHRVPLDHADGISRFSLEMGTPNDVARRLGQRKM